MGVRFHVFATVEAGVSPAWFWEFAAGSLLRRSRCEGWTVALTDCSPITHY